MRGLSAHFNVSFCPCGVEGIPIPEPMKQTNFFWHSASGVPVLDRRLARATAAAVLRDWRKSARVGVARLRRVVQVGACAYLVERCGAVDGLYVQPDPLASNTPIQAPVPAAVLAYEDEPDCWQRELKFNLETI